MSHLRLARRQGWGWAQGAAQSWQGPSADCLPREAAAVAPRHLMQQLLQQLQVHQFLQHTMRFGSTPKVPAERMLKYKFSGCNRPHPGLESTWSFGNLLGW